MSDSQMRIAHFYSEELGLVTSYYVCYFVSLPRHKNWNAAHTLFA
jgi:hypothetical protein